MIITGNDLGEKLCKLLGIERDNVSCITIKARTGEVTIVEVERWVSEEEGKALSAALEHYDIVLRPADISSPFKTEEVEAHKKKFENLHRTTSFVRPA